MPWHGGLRGLKLARSNSVSPDALAKSGAKVSVTGVDGQYTAAGRKP